MAVHFPPDLAVQAVHDVVRDDLVRRAALGDAAAIEESGVRAQRRDPIELMGDDHHRHASPHLAQPSEGLALEAEVADGEHFVDDQHVGLRCAAIANPSRAFMPLE